MMNNLPTIYKSELDGNISPIFPFYGKANSHIIETIVSLIGSELFEDPLVTLETIKDKMEIADKACIASRNTGKKSVNLQKRNCNRLTFGNHLMESLKKYILHILQYDSMKLPFDIDNAELEMSHGDILSYSEGGFFDVHRDGDVRQESTNDKIDQYSMILCLDSGEENHHSLSGCTTVILPKKNLLIYEQELDGARKHNKVVKMESHTYPQSRMKNYFVVFPSNALHKSHPITKGDFKLALKFDLFIKRPRLTTKEAIMHVGRNYYCSCLNCFPTIYRQETKHLIVPANSQDKLERTLLEMQNRKSLCECYENCCKICCSCTCANCIYTGEEEEIEQCEYCYDCNDYDGRSESDDEFCNGYSDSDSDF
jgi:predicted 2-oxoglutarate/Fe(II)-dependent dioxygenase YbiX